MEEIGAWMNGSTRIYPIPYKVCATRIEILTLYNQYLAMGYEGIVARAQGKIFKVKPIRSIDCVLTGINKRDKLKRNQITSLKLAVMDERGRYIDLGDVASGIDLQLRDYLKKLLDFKVGEDQDTIYIRPFVVLEVEYQETFEAEKPVREFVDGRFVTVGRVDYFSLRSPRLKRFRPDKRATPIDIPSSQLLEEETSLPASREIPLLENPLRCKMGLSHCLKMRYVRVEGFIIGLAILASVFLLPFTFRGARPLTLYEVFETLTSFISDIQRLTPQYMMLNYLFIAVFVLLVIAGLVGALPMASGAIGVAGMASISIAMDVVGAETVWGIGYYVLWALSLSTLVYSIWSRART